MTELQNGILRYVTGFMEKSGGITGGHMERTGKYIEIFLDILKTKTTYNKVSLSWNRELFIRSAFMHDLGKISVKDSIIYKSGKLTKAEYEEMKRHTILGLKIIDTLREYSSSNTLLQYAKILIGTHHEWWNGKGYPEGLKGREIPLQGRIMAIVDVYDALISERPYKKPFSHEDAVKIILQESGNHFDPVLTECFLVSSDLFAKAAFRPAS